MNIKKLREIAQAGKVEGRERPWFYRSLQRGPSIYITTLFLKTSISPNSISFLSIIVGILGTIILFLPGYGPLIIALLLFYLNILLDKVDGEVARYRKIFSLKGIFLDNINHLLIPALFFMGMTFRITLFGDLNYFVLLAGFGGAIAMALIRTGWSLSAQIYAKKYLKHPELFALPESRKTSVEEAKESHSFLSYLLWIVHQFQEFFMIIFVFLVIIVLEMLLDKALLEYTLIFFGILLPLVFIENSIKGYLSIEHRIKAQKERFNA